MEEELGTRKKVLGRGLKALLEDIPVTRVEEEGVITEVSLEAIAPNRMQPRKDFDAAALEELSDSIRATGVLQPVIVRRNEGGYELIAGERRWRAAQLAGLKTIPVIIREVNDREMLTLALIENIQRENLNPIEEAEAYSQLQQQFSFTQEELASGVGKSRTTITNCLRLLELPESIKKLVLEGKLSAGHARALLAIEGDAGRLSAAKLVMDKELSVRETERLAKRYQEIKKKPGKRSIATKHDPFIADVEQELQRILATKVRIKQKNSKKGILEIEYYNLDDLERIIEKLKG